MSRHRSANLRSRIAVALGTLFAPLFTEATSARAETGFVLAGSKVVSPPEGTPRERKAVQLFFEEVAARTGLRFEIVPEWPKEPKGPVIAIGRSERINRLNPRVETWAAELSAPPGAEGYRILSGTDPSVVAVLGNDERGVLFGVGRLLRELRMGPGRVELAGTLRIASAPVMGLRGHQLGYRPKTNSYDGWDVDQWEQYIRDLAVFGTNAIELIPPRSDDEPTSPHFPRPPGEMMEHMSKLADNYGLDVWIWYPAMDEDYEQEATVAAAIREWGAIFARLPRVDAVFVPGGDPGHTRPRSLFALLERQTESLRRYHPNASMWVSPQSFDAEGLEEFLDLVKKEPSWLGGIVFGPQVRIPLAELRQAIPARYPIRGYPDITHSLNCQHPVPNWDLAFALTQEREVINPRPLDQAAIFRAYQPSTVGFLTYSEGCNDDVNKMVWSGLGWDPQVPVIELLRQYGRYFVGAELGEAFAQGLLALERNWRGPLIANSDVEITLAQFQQLERSARPQTLANWRFQQALYRAYYDAYLRDRLLAETAAESEARQMLRRASTVGTLEAMDRAEALLLGPVLDPVSVDRRARIDALAEALFQSIQMQLDVTRYRGQEGRGTTQHTIDTPLSDRLWLQSEFRRLRSLDTEEARVQGIDRILDRTTPSPGGWYAQPGDLARAGQVVPGQSYPEDPDFRRSPLIGFDYRPGWPMAWCRNIQTLYDQPLQMRFDDLSPDSKYRVRIVYAGDNFRWKVRLEADGHEVHPFLAKPDPPRPLEFALPIEATGNGSVVLQFQREPGKGGNGRGCQVAEVWLEPVSP